MQIKCSIIAKILLYYLLQRLWFPLDSGTTCLDFSVILIFIVSIKLPTLVSKANPVAFSFCVYYYKNYHFSMYHNRNLSCFGGNKVPSRDTDLFYDSAIEFRCTFHDFIRLFFQLAILDWKWWCQLEAFYKRQLLEIKASLKQPLKASSDLKLLRNFLAPLIGIQSYF